MAVTPKLPNSTIPKGGHSYEEKYPEESVCPYHLFWNKRY